MVKVLVADDDPDIRNLMQIALSRAGFDVDDVGNGTAALETCRTADYEIAVLDINMPGMSGLEVVRGLRSDQATADMGIVLVSARATRDDVARGLEAGADTYLTKPFKVTGLQAAVRALDHGAIARSA